MLTQSLQYTALSEGSIVKVILTWRLQYTALSKGWHKTGVITKARIGGMSLSFQA